MNEKLNSDQWRAFISTNQLTQHKKQGLWDSCKTSIPQISKIRNVGAR